MIRHAITTSELRLFESDDPAPMAPYDACCILVWETDRTVWLRMLHGSLSMRLLRQLINWLAAHGVETVRAHRAPRRLMPLAAQREDGSYELRIADAIEHGATRSRWGDL